MKNCFKSHPLKHMRIGAFLTDARGNITILFAFMFSILLGGLMVTIDISNHTQETQFARQIAQNACNRVVRSSFTQYPTAATKKSAGLSVINSSYKNRKNIKNFTSEIEIGTNTAAVTLKATRKNALNIGVVSNLLGDEIVETAECAGIPPFPRVDEIIYAGNFGASMTSETPYKYQNACLGTIDPEKIGWSSSPLLESTISTERCGLEVQNWEACQNFLPSNAKDPSHLLPATATNGYVIELDGHCNTAINKTFELHPGTYEFSIWYRGRFVFSELEKRDTNQIGMYLQEVAKDTLEPIDTLSEKHKVLTMSDPDSKSWEEYTHVIEVPEYAMYRITLMGEGRNDRLGGLFTSFNLTYKELKKSVSDGHASRPNP